MQCSSPIFKIFLSVTLFAIAVVPSFASEELTFTGGSLEDSVNNQTIGWSFSVNSALKLTDLSWYDPTGTHRFDRLVGIWDSNGNLVVSTCVGPGCGSTYDSGFWVTSATADLPVGTYVIGGYVRANGDDPFDLGNPRIKTDPRITWTEALFTVSRSFTEPMKHCCGNGFFGPDFIVQGAQTPEPASLVLAVLGLGLTGVSRRLRAWRH